MYFINKNRYATLVYGKREAYISATANHHNHLILTGINESSHLFWWMFFFFFSERYTIPYHVALQMTCSLMQAPFLAVV